MQLFSFPFKFVGRVGTVLVRPISRPTVEQKTEDCTKHGGFDTPLRGYSTTGVIMEEGWLDD